MGYSFKSFELRAPSGILDTRSRPADLPPGAMRWKESFYVNDNGKLCRRPGWSRFAVLNASGNFDHHSQGAEREPITLLYESTAPDGTRALYDGSASRLSRLDETSGVWTALTGVPAAASPTGVRWHAAALQDYILFTNNHDDILAHQLGTDTVATIPGLVNDRKVSKARVIVSFCGFIMLMNVVQDANADATDILGGRQSSRIIWGDLNQPITNWKVGVSGSLAGFQDLDYGEAIIAAAPLAGSLLIYTTRSIWRCTVTIGAAAGSVFSFNKIYTEPRNQTGCLLYAHSLVSTGESHYFISRDGIYTYNDYIVAPERPEWAHRASGFMFDHLDEGCCEIPVAEYRPEAKEIWISFPQAIARLGSCRNDYCLVLNLRDKTADYVPLGFSAFVNFRLSPTTSSCNETQYFIGASTFDLCLKEYGAAFYHEFYKLPGGAVDFQQLPVADLSAAAGTPANYDRVGYYSIVRGEVPLGYTDRDKLLKHLLIDCVASQQVVPCVIQLRTGTSFNAEDANQVGGSCGVLWRQQPDLPLRCVEMETMAQMAAENLRPAAGTEWEVWEQGVFLYYEITVANKSLSGVISGAIGGDMQIARFSFKAANLLPV